VAPAHSRYGDMIVGVEIGNGSCDFDLTPYKGGLLSIS